jgi:type III pantothenate kinase
MQLIIDIGNTLVKYHVFDQDIIMESYFEEHVHWKRPLDKINKQFPEIRTAILSDVNGSFVEEIKEALFPLLIVHCSIDLKLPFETKYDPSKQLGQDRIALLAACCKFYPKKTTLIIDVGSCITYDLIDNNAVHQGGSISPGFSMRYKSMNDYSGKLPLLESLNKEHNLVGTSTTEAIHSGVYHGIANELLSVIADYKSNHEHLTVILTGGDAQMLSKPLKNSIFAHSNFLAEGLNHILVMNQIA